MTDIIPAGAIERRIYQIRGQRVMLGMDLADLFGVEHKALNQAVKRNAKRFPPDFVFQLTADEWAVLKSQIGPESSETGSTTGLSKSQFVTSTISGRGGAHRALPYGFTEHGCVMLSNVLRSDRAIQVSVSIVRAFVRLRSVLALNADLARRMEALEQQLRDHIGSTDQRFETLIMVVKDWMSEAEAPEPEPEPSPKRIGFRPDQNQAKRRQPDNTNG